MKATKVFQYRPFCLGSLKEAPPTELVLGNQGEAEETNVYTYRPFVFGSSIKRAPASLTARLGGSRGNVR